MALKNILVDNSIPQQKKFFKWYCRLPLILAILTLVSFFIAGIGDACRDPYPNELYGIFEVKSRFLVWLIWTLIGIHDSIITFIIFKILFSQPILTVQYLEIVSGQDSVKDTSEESNDNSDEFNDIPTKLESLNDLEENIRDLKQRYKFGEIDIKEYKNKSAALYKLYNKNKYLKKPTEKQTTKIDDREEKINALNKLYQSGEITKEQYLSNLSELFC